MSVNTCQHCRREFVCKRRDKQFCSSSCKWAGQQARPKTPPMPSEPMLALGLSLKRAAPKGTIGYRLGLKLAKTTFWFPPQACKSRRWDGSFSTRPYFVLTAKDFEPPRAPKAGNYILHFVGSDGQILVTPELFRNGVQIVEASRMSWPGTHQVRQVSDGRVRTLVDLGSGRSAGRAAMRRREG